MEHMKKFMSGNGGNCPTQISSMWVFNVEIIYDTSMSYLCTDEQSLYAWNIVIVYWKQVLFSLFFPVLVKHSQWWNNPGFGSHKSWVLKK